jgi:hypothetical protein
MSAHLKALQQALNTSTQRPAARRATAQPKAEKVVKPEPVAVIPAAAPVVASAPGEASKPVSQGSYMAPSREGKTNITAYLSPDYKSSLRLIQARTGKSLQALVAEALNDLFGKYDVPVVRGD